MPSFVYLNGWLNGGNDCFPPDILQFHLVVVEKAQKKQNNLLEDKSEAATDWVPFFFFYSSNLPWSVEEAAFITPGYSSGLTVQFDLFFFYSVHIRTTFKHWYHECTTSTTSATSARVHRASTMLRTCCSSNITVPKHISVQPRRYHHYPITEHHSSYWRPSKWNGSTIRCKVRVLYLFDTIIYLQLFSEANALARLHNSAINRLDIPLYSIKDRTK